MSQEKLALLASFCSIPISKESGKMLLGKTETVHKMEARLGNELTDANPKSREEYSHYNSLQILFYLINKSNRLSTNFRWVEVQICVHCVLTSPFD
jgi:hypothetical protein